MAAIIKRKRKDGSTSYFVKYRDGTGRQFFEQCDRWEEARSRKAEVEHELRKNRSWTPPERLTFSDYAETWLERRARHRVSERVLDNYERALRLVLCPEFGQMELGAIRRRHVNDLIGRLVSEGKARNTIRNYVVTPLRRMLNDAVDDELIPGNPVARIEIPRNAPVRQPQPPTPDELARILDSARPSARGPIVVMASLGLRIGETFALRWADVDFERSTVSVSKTNHAGRIAERTKTKAGTRLVPLYASARQVLLDLPAPSPESLVFPNAIGGALDPHNWRRREWQRALRLAGIERDIHAHDLRHFAATQLNDQGMDAKLRSTVVGHADERITNSVYTHVSRTRIEEAAGRFDPLSALVVDEW